MSKEGPTRYYDVLWDPNMHYEVLGRITTP